METIKWNKKGKEWESVEGLRVTREQKFPREMG